jgi:transposase
VARRTVLNEMRAIENVVRAILREGGIKLGTPARAASAGRVRELAGDDPLILPLVTPLLAILATMLEQLERFPLTPDRSRRQRSSLRTRLV